MSSVDFSSYIDLTVEDEDPDNLYEEAVEYGRNTFPELNLRAGTLEDALLQSVSFVGSKTIGAINRLPDGLMEGILKLHGLERLEATFSTVAVQFTLATAGSSVPAGTVIVFTSFENESTEQYAFILDDIVTAAAGQTVVSATMRATITGSIPGVAIGSILSVSEPSSNVLFATTTANVVNGNSDETTNDFLARGTTYLQSLSRVLTTADQVKNFILTTFLDVKRCQVYDLAKAVTFDPLAAENITLTGTAASIATNNGFIAASSGNTTFRILTPDFFGTSTYTEFEYGTYGGSFSGIDLNVVSVISGSGTTGPAKIINLSKLGLSYIESNPTPGFFTVFVCGQDGAPLSDALKEDIKVALDTRIVAGLSFQILDVFVYDVKFDISFAVETGYVAAEVVTALALELENSISPDNWDNWDGLVRIFDLVVQSSRVPGVSYVYSVAGVALLSNETRPGNDLLFTETLSSGQLVGYAPTYAGLLPRAQITASTA